MNNIEKYYNKFNEEKRFDSRHGQIEYRITMKYVHEAIDRLMKERGYTSPGELSILDIGAGTGRYCVALSKEGYDVSAVELVKYNLGILKKKNSAVKAYQGNAVRLKRFADDSFDLTLLFGPMYHLINDEDKVKALSEAKRVTKPGGYIFVAYVMNEYAVIMYGIQENHIKECMENGMLSENFRIIPGEEDLYDYVRMEDIARYNVAAGLEREKIISPDGAANYIRPFLRQLDDDGFERFVQYQMSVCERQELIGAAAHTVDILRKKETKGDSKKATFPVPTGPTGLGSLAERYLSRTVIKHIRKQDKTLSHGAAIGNDFACLDGMITADGTGDTPAIAWTKASNNFCCSGGVCKGARVYMLLPQGIKEGKLKSYMADFNSLAEANSIQLMGGHTEVSVAVVKPQFYVTLLGTKGEFNPIRRNVKPGMDIIMTKHVGLMGTNLILDEKYDELSERFAKSYLDGARIDESAYSIKKETECLLAAKGFALYYMHDVSFGGIYGALWQLGSWLERGILIDHTKLDIRQETIEICEYFNINPYMLEGTGSLLAVVDDGEAAAAALEEAGIEASVIGKVSEGNERMVVVNEIDKRCLCPVNGDEIYHITKG